jgi:hypothetical protein
VHTELRCSLQPAIRNAPCANPIQFLAQERLFRLTRSGFVPDEGDGFMLKKRSPRFVVLVTT